MSKHDLINMIITEKKLKNNIYARENDDLIMEEANEILEDNNFSRQALKENNIPNISPEAKAKPKTLNN